MVLAMSSFVVTLLGLCRCFKFNGKFYLLGTIGILVICFLILGKIQITIMDIFILFNPIFVLGNKNDLYPWMTCLYYIAAWMAYFVIRNPKDLKRVLKIVVIFSSINVLINLVNIYIPQIYFKAVKILLKSSALSDINYYYQTNGFISGLSDHYSRNAYFCVAGATVFAAMLFAEQKWKKCSVIGLFVNIFMIMIIGKRGHLLFLAVSLVYVFILKAPNISQKMMNLLKLVIIAGIATGIMVEMVPSVTYVFERFTFQQNSGDISTGRFFLWATALKLFKQKPLFGWGYGYFNTHIKNDFLNVYFAGVHNDYLQWLCELGIIGFIFNIIPMLGIYVLSIKEFKEIIRYKDVVAQENKVLIIWSVLFQTFVILYSLTGLPHFDYEINIIYYISLAVPMALLAQYEFSSIKVWRSKIIWRKN